MKKLFPFFLPVYLLATASLFSCGKINVYEKHASVPGFAWERTFKPEFRFENTSADSRYRIYLVVRHANAYRYSNLWVKLGITPKGDSTQTEEFNIPLTNDNQAWAGTGMDDIFTLRRELRFQKIRLDKNISNCTFTLEQVMRDNPLKHIMNIGLRIEKIP
ncbi:MAG: gliding motility lipoprotein GldH [Dinghuibacter sp.]|nr:gliding motility lipoprotein GldH [Dinghuibacter sp.]